MKKIIPFLIAFFITANAWAGDVSKAHTYINGEVLTHTNLNNSFDEIIVEVNDLDGDNFASNVAITTSGTMTLTGTFDAQGTTNNIGNGGSDTLTLNTPSGITYTPAATWTFTAAQTVSGTWADLGTVTTVDVNGGTWDGGTFGASSQITITDADVNGGTIDGVTIGATVAPTVTDLGSVATADMNGGTIDGMFLGITNEYDSIAFDEQGSDVSTSDNEMHCYTKESGGQSELFCREESDGDVVQITNNGLLDYGVEVFTSSGTWTCPTNVNNAHVTIVGGGGGGGGGSTGASDGGGGGEGGESIIGSAIDVTPSSTYTVTIGSAGTAGAINTAGGDGGDSSMVGDNYTLTANGGDGGDAGGGGGGTGGAGEAEGNTSLNASNASGGNFYKYPGGDGASGGFSNAGGGGGSSYVANGGDGSAGASGQAGQGIGAGGAGGGASGSGEAGGAGVQGIVIIWYNTNGSPS